VGATLLLSLAVWFVPVLRGLAEDGYFQGRHVMLGEQLPEVAKSVPSPPPTADPLKTLLERVNRLEAQVAGQSQQISRSQDAVASAQDQLKNATSEVAAGRALLQRRQTEWLAALRQAGVSVDAADTSPIDITSSPVSDTPQDNGLININTATAVQLDALPGIGPTYAQRIVAYREKNGPYKSADDLLNVSGIGPATLAKFKDKVTV